MDAKASEAFVRKQNETGWPRLLEALHYASELHAKHCRESGEEDKAKLSELLGSDTDVEKLVGMSRIVGRGKGFAATLHEIITRDLSEKVWDLFGADLDADFTVNRDLCTAYCWARLVDEQVDGVAHGSPCDHSIVLISKPLPDALKRGDPGSMQKVCTFFKRAAAQYVSCMRSFGQRNHATEFEREVIPLIASGKLPLGVAVKLAENMMRGAYYTAEADVLPVYEQSKPLSEVSANRFASLIHEALWRFVFVYNVFEKLAKIRKSG